MEGLIAPLFYGGMIMLYTQEGWLNWDHILSKNLPFNFVIGGRGIGKTYGILKKLLDEKIIIMRRTQSQIDVITKDMFNPYKSINIDLEREFHRGFETEGKGVYGIYDFGENEKGKMVPISECYGSAIALSTIKNLRGFDASNIDYLIFDEFIPEIHEREIKKEGIAFKNAYETINRNRELKGMKPVTAILMANANNLGSDIIIELGLVQVIDNMIKKETEEYIDTKKGLGIWLLRNSPISNAKKDTALYRLGGEEFQEMAIFNNFKSSGSLVIKSQNLKEYKIFCGIGGLYFYKHKSNDQIYVTTHKSGTCREYELSDIGKKQFKSENYFLQLCLLQNRILFETQYCYIVFTKL